MFQAPAAEFPNDNPALHRGAMWIRRDPCGPLEMEAREIEDVVVAAVTETPAPSIVAAIAPEPEAPIVMAEPEPEPDVEERETEIPAPLESLIVLAAPPRAEIEPAEPPEEDEIVVEELDFDLSNVPLESGPPPPPDSPATDDDAYGVLVKTLGDVVISEGGTAQAVQALLDGAQRTTALAWRAVLRGEVDDISTCGAAMLDEWAADVVAQALGAPAKATQLRRELRSRGVCAFGLVEAA